MKVAKKKIKDIMVCDCTRKKKSGKYYEGIDCMCTPYPNGSKESKKCKQVFITSVA